MSNFSGEILQISNYSCLCTKCNRDGKQNSMPTFLTVRHHANYIGGPQENLTGFLIQKDMERCLKLKLSSKQLVATQSFSHQYFQAKASHDSFQSVIVKMSGIWGFPVQQKANCVTWYNATSSITEHNESIAEHKLKSTFSYLNPEIGANRLRAWTCQNSTTSWKTFKEN